MRRNENEAIAKAAWNSMSDQFNGWDAISQDERGTYTEFAAALSAALSELTVEVSENEQLAEINSALKTINDTCLALQYDDRGRYGVETIEPLRNVAKLINKLVFQQAAEEKAVKVKEMDLEITKEWFERRAKAEADLEIGAGFSVVSPTDADLAQMEVLAERALPQWAQDELARLRSSLLDNSHASEEVVETWRTIETAPKDGTRIILMWEPFSGMSEHVELGKWSARNGWVNTYGHAFTGSPTHWMPLPAPPVLSSLRPAEVGSATSTKGISE
ncbi:DUF551 domain-containing protein [Shinella sp.]|uniref:DUF551 domain-containing protein n=1 Tax=Shinella sp. TaxID=1870904 RepID=UPI003F703F10